MSLVVHVIAIAACGLIGGVAGWWVTRAFAWEGAVGAIVAAIVGMVVATLVWIAGVAVLNLLSRPGTDK